MNRIIRVASFLMKYNKHQEWYYDLYQTINTLYSSLVSFRKLIICGLGLVNPKSILRQIRGSRWQVSDELIGANKLHTYGCYEGKLTNKGHLD